MSDHIDTERAGAVRLQKPSQYLPAMVADSMYSRTLLKPISVQSENEGAWVELRLYARGSGSVCSELEANEHGSKALGGTGHDAYILDISIGGSGFDELDEGGVARLIPAYHPSTSSTDNGYTGIVTVIRFCRKKPRFSGISGKQGKVKISISRGTKHTKVSRTSFVKNQIEKVGLKGIGS
jgi:hypothetical protein